MKPLLRRAVRTRAFAALVRGLSARARGTGRLLHVLTYHRIDDPDGAPDLHPALLSATPGDFDRQMAVVARWCRAVTPSEVARAVETGEPLPERAVLITFDDAYEDFETRTWPILRRRGLPATLFVATAYPGEPGRVFWWDRLHRAVRAGAAGARLALGEAVWPLDGEEARRAARRAAERHVASLLHDAGLREVARIERELGAAPGRGRVLDWDSLRRLAAEGVTLAPHSRTHPLMNRMPLAEAAAEAVGSLRDLEREVGSAPACFAYPGGAYPEDLPARLAAEGFHLALTTCRGANDLDAADPLRLRRINVGRTTSPALLELQLLPWMTRANRLFPVTGSP